MASARFHVFFFQFKIVFYCRIVSKATDNHNITILWFKSITIKSIFSINACCDFLKRFVVFN